MANQDEVPEEIQDEYYAPEKRERTGVAWLLAFATLIVTVLLATGLFFAGRWSYRQIAGNDDAPETPVVQNEDQNGEEAEEAEEEEAPATEDEQPETLPGDGDEPAAEPEVEGDREIAATGDAEAGDDLPATGPEHVLSAFLAISILGYILHRVYLRKSQT